MKLRIKSMIWNIRKQKTTNQKNKKQREEKNNEDRVRNLWDNVKRTNIHIIGVPEREEKEQYTGNPFEKIMKEIFPNLVKDKDMQVQAAQRVPNKVDAKRTTSRYIIIKTPKVKGKERILKAAGEKQIVTYKEIFITLSVDFSKETLQDRRDWQEVFKVMKRKDIQTRLLCPAKLSFRMEGQIKCFPYKVKLKEFVLTKLLLYEMLKGLI